MCHGDNVPVALLLLVSGMTYGRKSYRERQRQRDRRGGVERTEDKSKGHIVFHGWHR